MLLLLLAYLGGVLTILSPCILPVLPFVFARADRPFLRSGLPLLAGMAATFAAVGGGWAVHANQVGRALAAALLAAFGATLVWPRLAERLMHPLVSAGNRLAVLAHGFHARDLHLVLGPGVGSKPVHFLIRIDGAAPGDAHGGDVAPDGSGVVTEPRLYQLVRQRGPVTDHTFEIDFLDPGVRAYSFTFG